MKDIKSTLKSHLLINCVSSVVLLSFMAIPQLASLRQSIANTIGASESILWVPIVGFILLAQYFVFRKSIRLIAAPLENLAHVAEQEVHSFAALKHSQTAEEESLKRSMTSKFLQLKDALDKISEIDTQLTRQTERSDELSQKAASLTSNLEESDQSRRDLKIENESLKANKLALELTLENERKSKVGAEVQKRSDEIYAQMERAIAAAAYKAIWIPSLVHEIKAPIDAIRDLAHGLSENWDDTSPSKVKEEVKVICEQSEIQLSLLQDILARQPKDFEIPSETPTPIEEPPAIETPPEPMPSRPKLSIEKDTPQNVDTQEVLEIPIILESKIEPSVAETPTPSGILTERPALSLDADAEEPIIITDSNPLTTPRSEDDLQLILEAMVIEYSKRAPNANITYALDPELEIELTDESLIALVRCLLEAAVDQVEEGDITIGVDLHPSSIEFDVACDGRLKAGDPVHIARANKFADDLRVTIDVDATSTSELHLSFHYRFDTVEV